MPGFHPDCNSGGEPSRKVWAKKRATNLVTHKNKKSNLNDCSFLQLKFIKIKSKRLYYLSHRFIK